MSWRQADGEFEAGNAATVTTTSANITVDDYGRWVVRLEACDDDACSQGVEQTAGIRPGLPANLEVATTLNRLDVTATWDALDGADSYKLSWRRSNGEFEAANAVTVTDNQAGFTVSGSGQWEVWLEGCNDAGCGQLTIGRFSVDRVERQLSQAQTDTPGSVPLVRGNNICNDCPDAPTGTVTPGPGHGEITLKWEPATTGVEPVEPWEWRMGIAGSGQSFDYTVLPSSARTYTFSGLDVTITHTIQIRARHGIHTGFQGGVSQSPPIKPFDDGPEPTAATVNGNALTVTFDEALVTSSAPTASAFQVSVTPPAGRGITTHAKSAVFATTTSVLVTLYKAVAAGDTVTLRYINQGFAGAVPVQNTNGGRAQDFPADPFESYPVTNNTLAGPADTVPPVFASAVVDGSLLTVAFNEDLHTPWNPSGGAFTVSATPDGGGTARTIRGTDVAWVFNGAARTVRVNLPTAVETGETVTVSYDQPAANGLRDRLGNQVASFAGQPAANGTSASSPKPPQPPAKVSVEGSLLKLTYYEPLANFSEGQTSTRAPVSRPPGSAFVLTAHFAPTLAQSRDCTAGCAISGVGATDFSGHEVWVRLDASIPRGAYAKLTYTQPETTSLTGFSDQEAPVREDTNAPTLRGAVVASQMLRLTFSQELDENRLPPDGAFHVTVNGTKRDAEVLGISPPETVNLLLSPAVAAGDRVAVRYTAEPGNNLMVRDLSRRVASFGDRPVRVDASSSASPLSDVLPPVLDSASVNGGRLTIRLSEALDRSSAAAPADFHVAVNGQRRNVAAGGVSLASQNVSLTLESPVTREDAVQLRYVKGANPLRDRAGNEVDPFIHPAVVNRSAAPEVIALSVDGSTLTITFDEDIDPCCKGDWQVFVAGSVDGESYSGVGAISGNVLTLTLNNAVDPGQSVTILFDGGADAIRDRDGNMMPAWSAQRPVTNNTS